MMSPACALAIDEYKRTNRNLQRFWNLIYAVAAATAVMLVVAVVTLAFSDTAFAVVPGAASVLGGAGVATLIKLKNDAYREHTVAVAAVREDCATAAARGGEAVAASDIEELIAALVE